jgi:transcriptional regulator with GAF, ATPase, and Fis domain
VPKALRADDIESTRMPLDSKRSPAKSEANRLSEFERALGRSATPDLACGKLARTLQVAPNEVALLRLEKGQLRFIYPAELRQAGTIPLSGSAVAARTAVTRTSLLSNSFARVRHVSLFESVKLRGAEASEENDPMPIQKIISVPLSSGDRVVGVIQVSRKGLDLALAGADFTSEDLKLLEHAAQIMAEMPFMQEDVPVGEATT